MTKTEFVEWAILNGWEPSDYNTWFEKEGTKDILQLVAGCFQLGRHFKAAKMRIPIDCLYSPDGIELHAKLIFEEDDR